jgi:hypothetical protein
MASDRLIKRLVVAAIVVGAGAFAAMNPGVVKAFYEDLYPSDPAKRQALDLCFMQDHKFNRLDAGERDACYQHMLQPLGEVAPGAPPNVNPVDLQRAAGQTGAPRNDIRRIEQSANAPHASR